MVIFSGRGRSLWRIHLCINAIIWLQLLWPLGVAPSLGAQRPSRLVFSHYMACCPFGGHNATVDALRHEMEIAASAGIDGFAVNVGAWLKEPYYQDISSRLFSAAHLARFKLFFSADASTGLSASEVVDMVALFSGSDSYLRHMGQPVLSTFGGTAEWYKDIVDGLSAKAIPVFFVPNARRPEHANISGRLIETPDPRTINNILADLTVGDGLFYFGAAGQYLAIARSIRDGAQLSHAYSKLYMAPVTPYYRGLHQNFRAFESDGFAGMAEQWKAAIESEADWVEIVTWNDWGESSYVRPFEGESTIGLWNNHWGLLTAHDAYLNLSKYYIGWFKNGSLPITQNRIHVFYRPQASAQCRSITFAPCPRGAADLRDDLHIVAETSQRVTIELTMGSKSHFFDSEGGLHFYKAHLVPGPITIVCHSGNGSVRWEAPITYGSKESELTNFNYLATSLRLSAESDDSFEKKK